MSCYANKHSTNLKFSEFRSFFNINTGIGKADIHDIFCSFYRILNKQIPTNLVPLTTQQREIMSKYIQKHESKDEASKIYLFDLRKTGNRSEYNNDKAAARYPDIYEHFQNDNEYSFYFTDEAEKEVTLNQLLEKLEKRFASQS